MEGEQKTNEAEAFNASTLQSPSSESGIRTPEVQASSEQRTANGEYPDSRPNTEHATPNTSSPALTTIERSILEGEVVEQLRSVFDPEIPVNIYDLGLIYDIQIDPAKNVKVVMTLTSPMCPVAGSLPGEVEQAVRDTPGIGNVTVELTWDPPFTVDRMSEEVKLMLGLI